MQFKLSHGKDILFSSPASKVTDVLAECRQQVSCSSRVMLGAGHHLALPSESQAELEIENM